MSNQHLTQLIPARLVLATGETFAGVAPKGQQDGYGEVVFNTGMVGYTETLTDPSYTKQLITFTYPLLGNYGVTSQALWESDRIQASGVIMSELALHYSNPHAQQSLLDWMVTEKIPFISGIDTRALTKVLRSQGSTAGIITTQPGNDYHFSDINTEHLVQQVSPHQVTEHGAGNKTVIAIDCGMKNNILRCLERYPIKIKRVPFDYDFSQEAFDGVFISNGPGDPALCTETIATLQKVMPHAKPMFGICLGAQLMGLAIGAKTYKLPFGHRGQNHPCLHISSKRCFLTSQNHGYAIDEQSLPQSWHVSFRHLNDNTVAGIAHKTLPFFAVQFHPEAHPGPIDTQWLFDDFFKLL